MNKLVAALAAATALSAPAAALAGTVTFTDGTFAPANYAETVHTTSGATIVGDQCASCGDPAQALQVLVTFSTSGSDADEAFNNTTFSYDPATQGPILSLSAAVDKSVTIPGIVAGAVTSFFRPMIVQDGKYYLASIPVPAVFTGDTTGYVYASAPALTAADFTQFDFSTGSLITGSNPNFAGDPLTLGLAQVTHAGNTLFPNEEVDYDNLQFVLTTAAVPEPATWALLLAGIGAAGGALRGRRRKLAMALAG